MDASDWTRVIGPALFGAVAGALYGYVTSAMEKPLSAGTTGWTDSGRKLVLTGRVAAYGSLGPALLTIADRNAVSTERLRRIMMAVEQLILLQQRADAAAAVVEEMGDEAARPVQRSITQGMDEADLIASAHRYRDAALALLSEGFAERNVPMSAEGTPHEPQLAYAVDVILSALEGITFNIGIAVRKWRGG
jgi:hypothetical protein